ncbi:MAG: PEP-CTERM sorting domain-containing protein [Rhizobium sp.]|nr:PEP-CTERM sorting domain-containing protein [Rhizobium sp.]
MITRIWTQMALVTVLGLSGTAQAALQGRDLDGNLAAFEAYYDTDLNITWLANANANGPMTWAAANTWAANLSFYDVVNNITYDNWRLPTVNPVNGTSFNYTTSFDGSTDVGYNVSEQGTLFAGSTGSEMAHLYYNTLNNKGYCPVSTNCSPAPQGGWGLNNTGPFTNLQVGGYWSATEYAPDTAVYAWYFAFNSGLQYSVGKNAYLSALAVSPGDIGIAAVPEADTWAMLLAGLGLVGAVTGRRRS